MWDKFYAKLAESSKIILHLNYLTFDQISLLLIAEFNQYRKDFSLLQIVKHAWVE